MMLYDNHYIDQVIQIIETPLSFEGFEEVMNSVMPVLYHQWRADTFSDVSSDRYIALQNALRSKIVDYIKQGHLLDNNYINLFFLFRNCELSNDPNTESLIRLIEPAYEEYGADQKEKFIFAHLLFVLHFLNANGKKGIELFLSEHLFFDGKVYSAMDKDAQKLKEFLIAHSITLEEVANAIALGLESKSFMSRSRSQQLNAVVWILGFFWQINGYENHCAWRDVVYPRLLILFRSFLKIEDTIEVVMHLHFLMSHIYMNGAQTQDEFRIFNQDVEEAASVYYQEWGKKHFVPEAADGKKSSGKIKIALIKDRIVWNSPSKVEFSLLKQLQQNSDFTDRFELIVYTLSLVEKSFDDPSLIKELRDLGIKVKEVATQTLDSGSTYQSHLKRTLAVREDMRLEGIGVMIIATNNFPEVNFLFSTRSVTKQIFWCHGNTVFDVLGIDKRISHFVISNDECNFKNFQISMDSDRFYVPYVNPKIIAEERSKYPKTTFILGVIGRLVKVDSDEYLKTIAEIMQKNPQTIFIAAGSGHMESIRNKVEKLGISNRFYMPGFVNPHVYGYIINLWMDTFPLSGGEAVEEFHAKGGVCMLKTDDPNYVKKVSESLKTDNIRQDFLDEYDYDKILDRNGELLGLARYAYSKNEYVEKASRFINDTALMEDYQILIKQQSAFFHRITKNNTAKQFIGFCL